MVARSLLETVGIFAAFTVAFVPLWLARLLPRECAIPWHSSGGFALSAWFSFAVRHRCWRGLSELNEAVHHFVAPVMYISLPLTGVFTMVDWLPARAQAVMMWSPLVNGSEMFRSGLFPADIVTHWSASYLVLCCLVVSSAGAGRCAAWPSAASRCHDGVGSSSTSGSRRPAATAFQIFWRQPSGDPAGAARRPLSPLSRATSS